MMVIALIRRVCDLKPPVTGFTCCVPPRPETFYYEEPFFIGFGEIIVRSVERADRQRRAVIALGILLASCRYTFALNPSLSINQYAHTAWTIREGFSKGIINAITQT